MIKCSSAKTNAKLATCTAPTPCRNSLAGEQYCCWGVSVGDCCSGSAASCCGQQGKRVLGIASKVALIRQGQPQRCSAWPGGNFSQRFGLVSIRRRQQTGESPEEMLIRLARSLKNMSCKKRKSKPNLSRSGRAKPEQGYENSLLKC